MNFDFQRIREDDFLDPSIKQISQFHDIEMRNIFHCDGLLLCLTMDGSRLVVWNPYLGQTRWIQISNNFDGSYKYVSENMYALGYDNNNNYKILRFLYKDSQSGEHLFLFEIYNLKSSSWRLLQVLNSDLHICNYRSGVSLKGNTYYSARDVKGFDIEVFLLCFDFEQERFGPRLSLPFHSYCADFVILPCATEDQLAVLYQRHNEKILEIWISTKIEPCAVSWSKFLEVDMRNLDFGPNAFEVANFFIDEEKKVAVVCDSYYFRPTSTAYILGEDEYFKSVNIGEASKLGKLDEFSCPLNIYWDLHGFSFYVPSLVQVQTKPTLKRKERDY